MADSAPCVVVRSIRDEKPLHFTLKIQSFSLLKDALAKSQCEKYESESFNVGGYKWKLALYPNGDAKRNGSDHISLYLVSAVDNISLSIHSEVNLVFTFLVYDNLKEVFGSPSHLNDGMRSFYKAMIDLHVDARKSHLIIYHDRIFNSDGKVRRFHAMKTEWGMEKLVSLKTFNDASNGMLVDDCCAFGVDVFVMKCDDGKGETLSFVKKPSHNKYTWKVNKFSQLDNTFKESDLFTLNNYRWKIRLVKGVDFLSLYLILDGFIKLPQSSMVYAEFEMAVLNQLDKGSPKTRTFNRWFEFGGKGFGWGVLEFIPLSDLNEPTKGFIRKDTLIVEVKINVVSIKKFLS